MSPFLWPILDRLRHSAHLCYHLSAAGGDEQIRTVDPLLAGQVLSQLSYTPVLESGLSKLNSSEQTRYRPR